MKLRKALAYFFERYEISWELFMVALAIVFVAIGFLPDFFDFPESSLAILDGIDLGITSFFILEFVTRMLVASSRRRYLKEHWLDLVAILPVMRWLRVARLVRVFRLLRIARMARVIGSLDRLGFNLGKFAKLNGLWQMLVALVVIMLISSGLLFLFEYRVNDKINNYWDALYASLVTWTTPGYGDIAPITTGGHIFGLILIISGLITWGILIANLASFLTTRRADEEDRLNPAIKEIQQKLMQLDQLSETELIALRGAVNALIDNKLGELPDYTI